MWANTIPVKYSTVQAPPIAVLVSDLSQSQSTHLALNKSPMRVFFNDHPLLCGCYAYSSATTTDALLQGLHFAEQVIKLAPTLEVPHDALAHPAQLTVVKRRKYLKVHRVNGLRRTILAGSVVSVSCSFVVREPLMRIIFIASLNFLASRE